MDLADYRYHVDWDNGPAQSPPVNPFLGTFDDISAYVLKAEWSYGNDSGQPGQTKAGSCTITLDNSSSIFSSYNTTSDIYGKILPGIRVKVEMRVAFGGWIPMWQGFLDSIVPVVGPTVTVSTAVLQAYGPLQQISEEADVDIAMQEDVTTGAAMELILDAAGYSSTDRDIDTGQSTISRFWARKGRTLELLRELEAEETGLLRETYDGKIQHEDRGHRPGSHGTPARSTYGTGVLNMWDLEQENPLLNIYNSVTAQVRTFNKSEYTTLATIVDVRNGQGGPPIPIANGETKVFNIEIPNPSSPSQFLAVDTWGTVNLQIYTNDDGTGTDLTNDPDMDLSREPLGRTLRLTFHNGTGSSGYIVVLSVMGTAVVEGDPLTVSAEDDASISKYRKRPFPNPSQWLTQLDEGQDYCDHIIALYKNPRPALRFTLKANYDSTHLAEASLLDVSDRIHITADLATFGLALDGDFWVEHLKHTVDEARLHTVQVYCQAIVEHTWPASGTSYTAKEIPAGVPDDLYVRSIDPDLHVVCGGNAWKFNENITGARFRARWFAAPLGEGDSADLRTIAEGGDLEDDLVESPAAGTMIVKNDLVANQYGAQYEFDSPAEGSWYFAFQFKSKAGDSVWSDGNKTPRYVTDHINTTSTEGATGPASDWWVEVHADPSGRHAVIVKASRPKVNGGKIWDWRVQIKDNRSGAWYPIHWDPAALLTNPDVHYGHYTSWAGAAYPPPADDDPAWKIHTLSLDNRRFTRTDGVGLLGPHADDWVAPGHLILFDRRGGTWAADYCQWGTVTTVQGVKTGFTPATSTYFDVKGRFHTDVTTDIRVIVIKPPWEWYSGGYFGGELNGGMWEKNFWDEGEHGDTETEVFVSDPIDVPSTVPLEFIEARVWFDNGYSVSSNGDTIGTMTGDTGNPSGASGLEIITPEIDPTVPAGQVAFEFHRDTSNYRGIYRVAVVLSTTLPAEGPYSTERAAHPDEIVETGTCTIIAGNKAITVVRPSPPASDVVSRVFVLTSSDGTLDGNVIAAETATTITLTKAFNKSGSYNYAILKRWWSVGNGSGSPPVAETSNIRYYEFDIPFDIGDREQVVWRTPSVPAPEGDFYATVYSRNSYGIGTRITAGTASTPTVLTAKGCTILSIAGGEVAIDCTNNQRTFYLEASENFKLMNPTGLDYCFQPIAIFIKQTAGGNHVMTLDTKWKLGTSLTSATLSLTDGKVDVLGAVYLLVDDEIEIVALMRGY